MIALLDANVLIALFDPSHVHHQLAHAWFGSNRHHRWATCSTTENAFIRILPSPAYPGFAISIADAIFRLRDLCSTRDHVFWPEALSLRESERFHWQRVQGHRQITDVYLLALAVINTGRLVTFDGNIPLRAVAGATAQNLEVIGR
jgi:uncharacterized protein